MKIEVCDFCHSQPAKVIGIPLGRFEDEDSVSLSWLHPEVAVCFDCMEKVFNNLIKYTIEKERYPSLYKILPPKK